MTSITNTAKPTTTFANVAKVSFAELWSSILTSWSSETRTWLVTGSLFSNTAKQRSLGSYTFLEIGSDLISAHGGAMSDSSGMINVSKPV